VGCVPKRQEASPWILTAWPAAQDDPLFDRNFLQLKAFYTDLRASLPPSQHEKPLLGLNLLRLLAQNRIAEFHVELELLDAAAQASVHVDFPRRLEQQLMEGMYDHLYDAVEDAPSPYMQSFVAQLQATVQTELAASAELVRHRRPRCFSAQCCLAKCNCGHIAQNLSYPVLHLTCDGFPGTVCRPSMAFSQASNPCWVYSAHVMHHPGSLWGGDQRRARTSPMHKAAGMPLRATGPWLASSGPIFFILLGVSFQWACCLPLLQR
jgi:hypothetical protein